MLATVASVTSANRMKRRLNELGISTCIIQTPQSIAKDGCGYSLRFDDCFKEELILNSKKMGIKIRAFYYENVVDGKKIYSKCE